MYRLHPGKEFRLQLELLPLLGRPCQNAGKAAEVVCCNKKIVFLTNGAYVGKDEAGIYYVNRDVGRAGDEAFFGHRELAGTQEIISFCRELEDRGVRHCLVSMGDMGKELQQLGNGLVGDGEALPQKAGDSAVFLDESSPFP